MKWLNFNSLRKRYAILTIILSIVMVAFSLIAQNRVDEDILSIESNIQERGKLYLHTQKVKNAINKFRDLLIKFQLDPNSVKDPKQISITINQALKHIERLSEIPWIKKNHYSTLPALANTLTELDSLAKKLIQVRLIPTELFPSIKIATFNMQPLNARVVQSLQLAITGVEESDLRAHYKEYALMIDIRYHWITMVSNFRIYILNQLHAFQPASRQNQLVLVSSFYKVISSKLSALKELESKDELSFSTIIALEEISPEIKDWIKYFYTVKKINETKMWRQDTLLYQEQLEPRLKKINYLLLSLDLGVEKFSDQDLYNLAEVSQLQVKAIWISTSISLIILIVGFISLVKLVLNPIANVTLALKEESKGIQTDLHPDISISETRNLISSFKEMRQQIHSRQDALEHHATHDSLTGLANRDLLNDRLEQAIHNSRLDKSNFAFLTMDLNRFKEVNDTLGHAVGDKLLQQVAKRLVDLLREVDVVVRLGGDEFAVLLTTAHEEKAKIISQKIVDDFHNVFIIDGTPLYIGISIGISVYPHHGVTSQKIQQVADIAMYVSKRNKTGFEVYDETQDEYSIGRLSLISELRLAIDKNQLFMEYQPVMDLKTGKVIGAEALLRWNHPERGTIYPDDIIPIAEQTSLINPITYWVIDSTAKYCEHLKQNGIDIKIAINLSVYNLQEPDFVKNVINIFKSNKISAPNFIMEVTESIMMTNPQKSIEVLNQLNDLGIEISVDDYGTGYSSLSYLKRLPISKLKIDKSFIMDMLENDNDAMIVRSTIELSRNLGMEVVAEGIEVKEALDLLTILDCHFGQGYYISRPISETAFEKWVIDKL